MKLESEPRQRCAECGAEQPHMIRMERGGPYCWTCLLQAADIVLVKSGEMIELKWRPPGLEDVAPWAAPKEKGRA